MQPFGATNQPNTCLWCGKKLYKGSRSQFFHSGTCGEMFGVRMAELGKRFKPIQPQEVQPDDSGSGQ